MGGTYLSGESPNISLSQRDAMNELPDASNESRSHSSLLRY